MKDSSTSNYSIIELEEIWVIILIKSPPPHFTSDGTEAQKSLVTCSGSDVSDLIEGFR